MSDSRDRGTIAHNFAHHPPKSEPQIKAHEAVREACKQAALQIDKFCHTSREKSLALTKLEEAMMWANASIARVGDAGVE